MRVHWIEFQVIFCYNEEMKKIITLALVFLLLIAPISSADEAVQSVVENPILLQLKQKLAEAKYRYYNLKNNVEAAHSNIEQIEKQVDTLQEAIDNLDKLINDTNAKIINVKSQIERQKMDIKELEEKTYLKLIPHLGKIGAMLGGWLKETRKSHSEFQSESHPKL